MFEEHEDRVLPEYLFHYLCSSSADAVLSAGAAFGGAALLCLAAVPVVQQLRQRR
ncbi:hypothetical protein [Streptomyces olivochromogenes]|uniref:hypothetical protein n=1 Tax=Streptomyces olivochromogenes TaxID=1963 RepID=UPI0036B7D582